MSFSSLKRLRRGCRGWGMCLIIVVSVRDLMWQSAGSSILGMVETASGLHRVRESKQRKCNLISDGLCEWCCSKLATLRHDSKLDCEWIAKKVDHLSRLNWFRSSIEREGIPPPHQILHD